MFRWGRGRRRPWLHTTQGLSCRCVHHHLRYDASRPLRNHLLALREYRCLRRCDRCSTRSRLPRRSRSRPGWAPHRGLRCPRTRLMRRCTIQGMLATSWRPPGSMRRLVPLAVYTSGTTNHRTEGLWRAQCPGRSRHHLLKEHRWRRVPKTLAWRQPSPMRHRLQQLHLLHLHAHLVANRQSTEVLLRRRL